MAHHHVLALPLGGNTSRRQLNSAILSAHSGTQMLRGLAQYISWQEKTLAEMHGDFQTLWLPATALGSECERTLGGRVWQRKNEVGGSWRCNGLA